MKKQIFILTVCCLALFSCKNNIEVESIVTVKLNPSFITLNEGTNEPMSVKSNGLMKMNSVITATDSVVYAIQVYENDAPYYYGLFNDVNKMQLALTTSKTYKFKVAAYKVGTGKGLKSIIDADGTNYYLPTKTPLKNIFIKGDILKDIDLASSAVLNNQTKIYPEVDAFYATKSLTLDKGTSSIDFTLLRMGFGINFTVDALTSGTMEIYVGNDTLQLNSTKAAAYTVRQFSTALNSFGSIYSNAATFGDSITVSAKWVSGSGTAVTATGKYKFLRNYQKTINVQLNTLTSNVSFESWKIPTDGLIAWYPFNGNANDGSGNGNNGVVYGATLTTDRLNNSNNAYSFNGSSNYISIPNSTSLQNISAFSLSVWVKINNWYGSGSYFPIIQKSDQSSQYGIYSVLVQPNSVYGNIGTKDCKISYSNWVLNSWKHIVFILTNTASSLYVNGNLISNGAPINWVQNPIQNLPLIIGMDKPGVVEYANGTIDDLGIWNRVLTQDEITALYNAK